jgi:hypothetical protein
LCRFLSQTLSLIRFQSHYSRISPRGSLWYSPERSCLNFLL